MHASAALCSVTTDLFMPCEGRCAKRVAADSSRVGRIDNSSNNTTPPRRDSITSLQLFHIVRPTQTMFKAAMLLHRCCVGCACVLLPLADADATSAVVNAVTAAATRYCCWCYR